MTTVMFCAHGVSLLQPCLPCDMVSGGPHRAPDPRTVQLACTAFEERTGLRAGGLLVNPRDADDLFLQAAVCGNYQPWAPTTYSGLRIFHVLTMKRGVQVVCTDKGRTGGAVMPVPPSPPNQPGVS